jgi:ubiquinone/menaquinone biosynthesis C-methylase UbiE
MTVLDIGCGMGYFAIPMAGMVGPQGKVIAVDLQQKMLDVLMKRAAGKNVADRIRPMKCEPGDLGKLPEVDFACAFFMVHEVPDPDRLLQQVCESLKPGAKFLVVEPRGEVGGPQFEGTILLAQKMGFTLTDRPKVRMSRAALFVAEK